MAGKFELGRGGDRRPPRSGGGGLRHRKRTTLWVLAAVIVVGVGWASLPLIRFALLKGQYESSEGEEREAALRRIIRLRTPLAIPILLGEIRESRGRELYLDDLIQLLQEEDLQFLIRQVQGESREGRAVAAYAIAAIVERPWVKGNEAVRDAAPGIYSALLDGLSGGPEAVDYVDSIRSVVEHLPGTDVVTPVVQKLRGEEGVDRSGAIRAIFYLRREPYISESPEIQALVREAMGSEEARVRIGAALVLEDQAVPEDRELLLEATEDPDSLVREVSCRALGNLGGEGVADTLLRRLADPAGRVREAAVLSLGQLRVERIVPDLLEMLQETATMEVRQGGALVRVANPHRAMAAAAILAHFPAPPVREALARAAGDAERDERIRLQAIRSLGGQRRPEALPSLEPILRDPEWIVRLEAIQAMQAIGGRAAVGLLVARLKEVVRSKAYRGEIEALGNALREITGKEYGPYPGEGRYEGELQVRRWEEWLGDDTTPR